MASAKPFFWKPERSIFGIDTSEDMDFWMASSVLDSDEARILEASSDVNDWFCICDAKLCVGRDATWEAGMAAEAIWAGLATLEAAGAGGDASVAALADWLERDETLGRSDWTAWAAIGWYCVVDSAIDGEAAMGCIDAA